MNEYSRLVDALSQARRRPPQVNSCLAVLGSLVMIALTLAACRTAPDQPSPTVAPTAAPVAALTATAGPTRTLPAVTAHPIASPQPTPTIRPTPCQIPVQPALVAAWQDYVVGCPITPGAAVVNTAYAPFEGGQMLWRGDTDTIYVLTHDGRWTSYANAWREGDPEFSCGAADPLITPVRGFGRVWCDHPDVREALGAVTAAEVGDNASVVQDFGNGMIITAPFGDLFVFENEAGTWRLVDIAP